MAASFAELVNLGIEDIAEDSFEVLKTETLEVIVAFEEYLESQERIIRDHCN